MRFLLLCYVLLVILVSLVPSSGDPSTWPIDKVGHFAAYAGMAVLAFLSFDTWTARLAALVGSVGLGAILEWGQSFVPGRDMSLVDALANTLGLLAGTMGFRFYGRVLSDWIKIQVRW
jgi:VanZ family protein